MKYYSEHTKKFYESEQECSKEERKFLKEKEAEANGRKVDAEKVKNAEKAFIDARRAYAEALNDFCSKHGPYHKTIEKGDEDLLDIIFGALFS